LRAVEVFDSGGQLVVARTFYPNGKAKEKISYRNGVPFGNAISFYQNGKIRMNYIFPDPSKFRNNMPFRFLIVNYLDSLGNFQVKNMKGVCDCPDFFQGYDIIERGKIVNGLRDSIWSGYQNDTLLFQESYTMGEFLGGINYSNGSEYHYTDFEEQPRFKGGTEALYKYVRNTLTYPLYARRMGAEGQVLVQFVIGKDGSVTDIEVMKGVAKDIDKEAVRIVSSMPNWIPGTQRGAPIKVQFVLPINFKLDL
jgi:TonB family protein